MDELFVLRRLVETLSEQSHNKGEIQAYKKVLAIADELIDASNEKEQDNYNHFTLELPKQSEDVEFNDYDHPI